MSITKSEMLDLIKACLYEPVVFIDSTNEEPPAMINAEELELMNEKAEAILATIDMVLNPNWDEE